MYYISIALIDFCWSILGEKKLSSSSFWLSFSLSCCDVFRFLPARELNFYPRFLFFSILSWSIVITSTSSIYYVGAKVDLGISPFYMPLENTPPSFLYFYWGLKSPKDLVCRGKVAGLLCWWISVEYLLAPLGISFDLVEIWIPFWFTKVFFLTIKTFVSSFTFYEVF